MASQSARRIEEGKKRMIKYRQFQFGHFKIRNPHVGQILPHKPVILIAAVTSRNSDAFTWAEETMSKRWGSLYRKSDLFEFTETTFYQASMGVDLKKQFFAFESNFDPAEIAHTKHVSNAWENEYAEQSNFDEERPINIDPGYISEAKLVLVTTKDRDHRLYLKDGIFAEVTLHFRGGEWTSSRWTYPDYQRKDFQNFFTDCRQYLRKQIQVWNRQNK